MSTSSSPDETANLLSAARVLALRACTPDVVSHVPGAFCVGLQPSRKGVAVLAEPSPVRLRCRGWSSSPEIAGRPMVSMGGLHCGSLEQAERHFAPMREFGSPVVDRVEQKPH